MAASYPDWFVGELNRALNVYIGHDAVGKAWLEDNRQTLIDYFHDEVDADQSKMKLLGLFRAPVCRSMDPGAMGNMMRWLAGMYGSCTRDHSGSIRTSGCEHGEAYIKWEERLRSQAIVIADSDDETDASKAGQVLNNTDQSCAMAAAYHIIHKTRLLPLVFDRLHPDITSIMLVGLINLDNDTCPGPPQELRDLYYAKTNKKLMSSNAGLSLNVLFKCIVDLSPKLELRVHIEETEITDLNHLWCNQRWFNEQLATLALPTGLRPWTWASISSPLTAMPARTPNIDPPGIHSALRQFSRLVTYLTDCEHSGIVAGAVHLTWQGDTGVARHYVAFARINDRVTFYNWGQSLLASELSAKLLLVHPDRLLVTPAARSAAHQICEFLMNDDVPFEMRQIAFLFERDRCPNHNSFHTIAELRLTGSQITETAVLLAALPLIEAEAAQWLKERSETETNLLQWYLWHIPDDVALVLPACLFWPFNAFWIQPQELKTEDSEADERAFVARAVYDELMLLVGGCLHPDTCARKAVPPSKYCTKHNPAKKQKMSADVQFRDRCL